MYAIRSYYVFAITNPEPEIDPRIAKKSGARIVATGSFKYENKVNNALVFPFLMRAILDLKIHVITSYSIHYTKLYEISPIPCLSHISAVDSVIHA